MSYVAHANAMLTPEGRLKLVRLVLEDGWTQARVAERLQVSRATVSRWVSRFRAQGLSGLTGAPRLITSGHAHNLRGKNT